LSERRTVIVRNVLRNEDWDSFGKKAKQLPSTALLVLVADEEGGDESRQRRFATIKRNWEKEIKLAGGEVASFELDPKKVTEHIRSEAERIDRKLSPAAAEMLAEMTGRSLSRAVEELEKLSIYLGDEKNIREADVRAVVIPAREWNVYKLVDAVMDDAMNEALRQLRILVGSAQKAEDAAFSRIFPTLSRQLRLLWQARVCVELGLSPASIPANQQGLFVEKQSIGKEPPYRQNKLVQQARRLSFPQLSAATIAVRDADSRIKGLADSFNAMETLERMVLDLGKALSPAARS
jgi:DNA polymerase-3 subunit delta